MLGAALVLGSAAALLVALGIRLWRFSAAGTPERWLALAFAALGCAALPRFIAARWIGMGELDALALALNAVSHLAFELGIVAFTVFVWRVFRPASGAARALAGVSILASSLFTVAIVVTTHTGQEGSALALAVGSSRSIPIVWAFVECTRYAHLMRRRQRLGLSDAVLANRFVLWSVWTGALGSSALVLLAVRGRAFWFLRQGIDPHLAMPWAVPTAGALVGCCIACASVAVWLAFFPPATYQRWLRARAA